jgi:hypothetical protein
MSQNLFVRNTIAIIWDFDKTLTPNYMQEPLFRRYGVDGPNFWHEVNGLEDLYIRHGAKRVSKDTLYLNHILTYVRLLQVLVLGFSAAAALGRGRRLSKA